MKMDLQTRTKYINELGNLVFNNNVNKSILKKDQTNYYMLPNLLTYKHCQIIEMVYDKDMNNCSLVPKSNHSYSTKIFYVLTGQLEFDTGEIIKAGEIKIIAPNTNHKCKLSKDGKCIIIIHPPDKTLLKGNEQHG